MLPSVMPDQGEAADVELLVAWAGGDKAAGRRLYARHHATVVRFFINKVGSEVADLAQETFLRALASAHAFRGEGSARGWLLGIAVNVLRQHLEAARKHDERFGAALVSVAATGGSPSAAMLQHQQHRQLLEALRELPAEMQLVLELHYWESLTNREISEILGEPLGTVQSRIRRAREQLARTLAATPAAAAPAISEALIDRWAREVRAGLGS